ncbi:MAG: rhomboid family intramembrane serine protease [Paracoccaceae bacterium]
MHSEPSPVNPLPPVVLALFFAIAGVEVIFAVGEAGFAGGPEAIGWRLNAIRDYGFSGSEFDWMIEQGRWPLERVMRFVTYPFVHGGITATVFSGVMLLAMGKLVGEVMGQIAVVVLFFGSAVLGAFVFGLLTSEARLIGAFPGVYGLIGGYTFLMWLKLGAAGASQSGAFSLIVMLMGIQLFFSIFFGTGPDWIADLAGFVAGFGLSTIVIPGGFARLLSRFRQR